ncbi:MAG: class I SAM-dependent methyltransferase [bacterium]
MSRLVCGGKASVRLWFVRQKNGGVDREDSRLERHQIERDVTFRFFESYIPLGARILEIGAATGVYTAWLAKREHSITAVDFSETLLERCKERIFADKLRGKVSFLVADARDLSEIPKNAFDVVLLMGPLYHLILEADRRKVLREAYARLKPNGLIFSALISRYGILGQLLLSHPEWIESQDDVRSILTYGKNHETTPKGGFRGYYCTVPEVTPLHESAGFEKIILAGVEPAISAYDETYNRLQGKQRQLWLDLFYKISTETSMIASSRHLLFIGKRRDKNERTVL